MGQSRREFIKSTNAALGVAGIAPLSVGRFATDALNPPQSIRESEIAPEPSITELAAVALDAAKSADAEYADVRFGPFVKRFRYLRPVDQRTILYTGLTRDGTFLIENGKVTKPVKFAISALPA